jgi:hypothetical protein
MSFTRYRAGITTATRSSPRSLTQWLGYMDAIRWSLADWPLHMLLRCSVEHLGWSDRACVGRQNPHHWLIFVPGFTDLVRSTDYRESLAVGT